MTSMSLTDTTETRNLSSLEGEQDARVKFELVRNDNDPAVNVPVQAVVGLYDENKLVEVKAFPKQMLSKALADVPIISVDNNSGRVTATGNFSSKPGMQITLKAVKKSTGQIVSLNQIATDSNGSYTYQFNVDTNTNEQYALSVGAGWLPVSQKVDFSYPFTEQSITNKISIVADFNIGQYNNVTDRWHFKLFAWKSVAGLEPLTEIVKLPETAATPMPTPTVTPTPTPPHMPGNNTREGTWALKCVLTTTATKRNIRQTVTTEPDTAYDLSMWVKGDSGCKITVKAYYKTDIIYDQITNTCDGTWQQIQFTFNTQSYNTTTVQIIDEKAGAAGTAYIDDCYLGKAVGSSVNLLDNPGFENGGHWNGGNTEVRLNDTFRAVQPDPIPASICYVKDNKKGIWTFTTDEHTLLETVQMDELFEPRGIRGTICMIGNLYEWNSEEKFAYKQSLIDSGRWDVSNHSWSHEPYVIACNEGNLDVLEYEINYAKEFFLSNLTGIKCVGYVTPNGKTCPDASEILHQNHWASRGTQYGNNSLDPVDLGLRDTTPGNWFNLKCYDQGKDLQKHKDHFNSAYNGRWVIELWHYVNIEDDPSYHPKIDPIIDSSYLDYVQSELGKGEIWNATYEEAIMYIRERQNSTLSIVNNTDTQIELSFTCSLDPEIFDYPVTLRVQVPTDWESAEIVQNGQIQNVIPTTDPESGAYYIYFNVPPNNGNIIIKKTANI